MTKPAIVVVHGALGSAAQMQPVADALSALGEVHTIEFPGHGETPPGEVVPFAMYSLIDALRAGIASRRLRQPLVFGYSMGGYVALLLESLSPGTLGGIVTLGTKIEWTPEVAAGAIARLDASVLRTKVPVFAEQLRVRHANAGGWEQVLTSTAALLGALGQRPRLTAQTLAAVTIPVRVAAGSRDDTLADGEAARLGALLPNATYTSLPDVPHPIERVPTALVVELVGGLLRDFPRS
ncbi:alpha/beta fold hydrolase [Gemmatimonas groenlandica]|uniref:Alpha/beta fold hydrolase n=1 Tax=Gemmatimonas groenlandica TaxID=2732249 RepID=A0A6M4IP63_9BACT|nr:alpha/beta fold hydrolase [Gemmatimonas groenlandica]QJR35728.1 alpha/beta fold hydrolase [Gemmatimonas groenlandica]